MQELRNDPEFKQMFEEIQKGGMGALMKYMNSPQARTSEAVTAAGCGHSGCSTCTCSARCLSNAEAHHKECAMHDCTCRCTLSASCGWRRCPALAFGVKQCAHQRALQCQIHNQAKKQV